jgi:outer membrane protein OmpA-like peptidoglycan-associated protein
VPGNKAPVPVKRTSGKGETTIRTDSSADTGTSGKRSQRSLYQGDRFSVGTLVRFAEDSAELDAEGLRVLDELTPELLGKRFRIEIRGHAARDRTGGGAARDPWDVSYARAVATMRYLAEKGVDTRRIRLSQIASNEPIPTHEGISAKAQQSMVEVYMLNEIVAEPGEAPPKKTREKPKRFGPKAPAAPAKAEQ